MSQLPASLMTAAEADLLVDLAGDKVVLEMGAWEGAQTIRMAKVCRRIWSVDRHTGDVHTGPADTLPTYIRQLEYAGVRHKVMVLAGDFDVMFEGLTYGYFDLVVVDGEHTRGAVFSDCTMAKMLVKPDGIIAVHDWGRHEVHIVAGSVLGEPDRVVESLAIWHAEQVK